MSHFFEDHRPRTLSLFERDVLQGFSKDKKYLLAKYFYDDRGSMLFNQITRHPDYYLTRCELEILEHYKTEFARLFKSQPFNLIELGPGEGIKTLILIEQFLKESLDFEYIPIDISQKYLKEIRHTLKHIIPSCRYKPVYFDYIQGLNWVNKTSQKRNVVLFLGSSIGNFDKEAMGIFLKEVRNSLREGDLFLIGFDLRKKNKTLMKAYSDSDGITKAFNLNLLHRMNRELYSNFNPHEFDHFARYNDDFGTMESYLISLKKQKIKIKALNQPFYFDKYESIHVENSYKFFLSQVEDFANIAGFKIIDHFFDKRGYFLNSLWGVL